MCFIELILLDQCYVVLSEGGSSQWFTVQTENILQTRQ